MTTITATTKPVLPVRKLEMFEVTVMDLQGLRKAEVQTALEAAGVESTRAYRFKQLWEVVKPEHLCGHGENDNEARGIIAHALFLQAYSQDMRGEVRYLYDRAGLYMRNRITVGDQVSERVFQVWHALRWLMLDWQMKRAGGA